MQVDAAAKKWHQLMPIVWSDVMPKNVPAE